MFPLASELGDASLVPWTVTVALLVPFTSEALVPCTSDPVEVPFTMVVGDELLVPFTVVIAELVPFTGLLEVVVGEEELVPFT